MPKVAIFLVSILAASLFFGTADGFLGGDMVHHQLEQDKNPLDMQTGILKFSENVNQKNSKIQRYLILGEGSISDLKNIVSNPLYGIESEKGFFSVGLISDSQKNLLQTSGYQVIEDFLVDFHAESVSQDSQANPSLDNEISRIGEISGSLKVHTQYNITGAGIKVAIVDTGVDFSNPDIQHSLARDEKNHPIMLDADGQGIILTNTTFAANIDEEGVIRNFTKSIPENVTSVVYKTKKGVFLDIAQKGKGTTLQIYNSFFPQAGPAPIINGTLGDDMKIGTTSQDYIKSKSGIYHLGVIYQGALEGPLTRLQVVPVLVVDSQTPGVYDTIIPDMSTSWEDFTRFDLPRGEKPNYDFDFTDETPIRLGSQKEFLVYDSNDDGKSDYSAGTVGAQVVDVYGVIDKKPSKIDDTIKAINGTLLPPLDPQGRFFGLMTDFMGHGTSSAASIVSKGIEKYDIYNNTKKYTIKGIAPDAKIVPIKALWFGDTVYGWLWAAGFDSVEQNWKFSGKPRADIISNSWGISNFPTLNSVPGMDILSLVSDTLATPRSLAGSYPGVTIVSSAGNSGHGYGTMGMPNSASFSIAVGATTNNVFVGYGPFKDQPRFGNTTEHKNHVVDFSSRGPGYLGDPKPDIMSIGAHSFTPSIVTKLEKDSKQESFSMFGGTSMAAPIVAGGAALVMEDLQKNLIRYDPFRVKSILMSSASDLNNDPLTQGSGLLNVTNAIRFLKGEPGMFIVYNEDSYKNVKNILNNSITSVNSSSLGLARFDLPEKNWPQTNWFAGHLFPGERSTTTFKIENPSKEPLNISVKPQTLKLIKKDTYNGQTEVHLKDSILNETGTYRPNYIELNKITQFKDLNSYYEQTIIPNDSSLLVLGVNFPFESFMNQTDKIYANDLKISSLYLYDWSDEDMDTKISSNELSLVNRAGSWGTMQEMRVSDPKDQFQDTPIVGIYPVPTRYSYWLGDTTKNSTSMNYTLSASYYKNDRWDIVWLNSEIITVPPKSTAEVTATIIAPSEYDTGIYQGFIKFQGEEHEVNLPVSFAVKKKIDQKDSLVLIKGKQTDDVIYGNGYVKGSFDMVNRYMAGDWRQYYFEIEDDSINSASLNISWENQDSNLSVFVIDPKGKIVATNVPAGVFGHFMNWVSLDWLGVSPFSQGGGFFPVKNNNETSTVLFSPINQTGTYGVLIHSTLFDGESQTEPISIAAKFSSINP